MMMETLSSSTPSQNHLGHAVSPPGLSSSSSSSSSSSTSSYSSVPFVDMMAPKVVVASTTNGSASPQSSAASTPDSNVLDGKMNGDLSNSSPPPHDSIRLQSSPSRSSDDRSDSCGALIIDEGADTRPLVNGYERQSDESSKPNCDNSSSGEGLMMVLASKASSSVSALPPNGTVAISTATGSSRSIIPALSVVAAVKSSNNQTTTIAAVQTTVSTTASIAGALNADLGAMVSSQQAQKRPMNAFLIFCKRHRSVVRAKYPHLENRSITKILGEWWASLDPEEKHNYTDLARQYKEAFMKANPHFKWYKTDLRPPPLPPSSVAQPAPPPASSVSVAPSSSSQSSTSGPAAALTSKSNNNNNTATTSAITNTGTSFPSVFANQDITVGIARINTKQTSSPIGATTVAATLPAATTVAVASNGSIQQQPQQQQPTSPSQSAASPTMLTNGSSTTAVASSSTPKPPKKRYLESMESGSDYTKTKATIPPTQLTATITTVQQLAQPSLSPPTTAGPSAMLLPTLSSSNTNGKPSLSTYKLPPFIDDDTANKVIERAFESTSSFASTLNNNSQQHKPPTSTIGGLCKTLQFEPSLFESKPRATGPSPMCGTNGHIDTVVQSALCAGKTIPTAHSPVASNGSDTASDEEMEHHLVEVKQQQQTIAASHMILQPRASASIAAPAQQSSDEEDDDDKPLNLSSTSTTPQQSNKVQEQVYQASNQMIIERFIDKFLNSGSVCNSNGYANALNAPNRHSESSLSLSSPIILKPQPSQPSATPASTGILNMTTTANNTTSFLSNAATITTTAPVVSSKLVLVPKDFSLQRSSSGPVPLTTTIVTSTPAVGNLVSNNNIITNNNVNSNNNNNSKRQMPEQNGSPIKIGTGAGNVNLLLKSGIETSQQQAQVVSTTPNKRNRINGTVIGVREMIEMQQQSNNAAQQQQNQSKFVTGSFDLEEHIRALPQLDHHLVNALHLRNVDQKGVPQQGTNLVVVSTSPATTAANIKSTAPAMIAKAPGQTTVLLQHHPQSPPPTAATVASLSNIPLHIQAENLSHASLGKLETTALPLRLVTTNASPLVAAGSPQRVAQVSPGQVLIKLGPGQTISAIPAGTTATLPMQAAMQPDGSIVPLILRGAPGTAGTPIAITTTGANNKPVDLSMAIQSADGTVGLHQLAAAVRTSGLPQQAYLTQGGPIIVTTTAPGSSLSALNSISIAGQQQQQLSASNSPSSSTSSNNNNNNIFSTVISSQGSINQCDGLAALAEIALQQARNIT